MRACESVRGDCECFKHIYTKCYCCCCFKSNYNFIRISMSSLPVIQLLYSHRYFSLISLARMEFALSLSIKLITCVYLLLFVTCRINHFPMIERKKPSTFEIACLCFFFVCFDISTTISRVVVTSKSNTPTHKFVHTYQTLTVRTFSM